MGNGNDLDKGIDLLASKKNEALSELQGLDAKLHLNQITLEKYKGEQRRLNEKIDRLMQDLFYLRLSKKNNSITERTGKIS